MSCDTPPAPPPEPPPEPPDAVRPPPAGVLAWAASLRPSSPPISAPVPPGGEVRLGVSGWCPHCRRPCFRNPIMGCCRACGEPAWPVERRRLAEDPPEGGDAWLEWEACREPRAMVRWLCGGAEMADGLGPVVGTRLVQVPGKRALRLFALSAALLAAPRMGQDAAAACRILAPVLWDHPLGEKYLRQAWGILARCREAALDRLDHSQAVTASLAMAFAAVNPLSLLACSGTFWVEAKEAGLPAAVMAGLARDAFGHPFNPPGVLCMGRRWRPGRRGLETALFPWATAQAATLARAALDDRDERGLLDGGRLGVLADCLEEAGCPADPRPGGLLEHLRGPWPHGIGCWAVSLILGK